MQRFFLTIMLIFLMSLNGYACPIFGESTEVLLPEQYCISTKIIKSVMKDCWDKDGHIVTTTGFKSTEIEIPIEIYYGATKDLELGLIMPFLWLREQSSQDAEENSGRGIGDVEASIKYNLLKPSQVTPAISGLLSIKLPTGREAKKNSSKLPTGSGSTDITFIGILSRNIHPFEAYLNLGYTITGKGKDEEGEETNSGNKLFYDITLDCLINEKITLVGELRGEFSDKGTSDKDKKWSLTTLITGIQYESTTIDGLTFNGGISTSLTGKNIEKSWSPILGIDYEF